MRPLPPLETAVGKVERAESLDGSVAAVKKAVDASLPSPAVRDALHGVSLGHPLHPALVTCRWAAGSPPPCSTSCPAAGGPRRRWSALGVLTAVPTAAAGAADWSDLHPQQQRTGLVHALATWSPSACRSPPGAPGAAAGTPAGWPSAWPR